jgi:hypothetical protein
MFIEQGIKSENTFWKYIKGSFIFIFASILGQLPLLLLLIYETTVKGKPYPSNDKAVMQFFEPNLTLFLVLVTFVFIMVSIILVVRYLHHQTLLSVTTSRAKVDWNRILFSFLIWAAFTIASTLLFYFYSPSDFVMNFKPIPFAILVLLGVFLIPIQTSTEEYISGDI